MKWVIDVDSMDSNVVIVGCGNIDNSNLCNLLRECLWEMPLPISHK
jgi:hypothetical protein